MLIQRFEDIFEESQSECAQPTCSFLIRLIHMLRDIVAACDLLDYPLANVGLCQVEIKLLTNQT